MDNIKAKILASGKTSQNLAIDNFYPISKKILGQFAEFWALLFSIWVKPQIDEGEQMETFIPASLIC